MHRQQRNKKIGKSYIYWVVTFYTVIRIHLNQYFLREKYRKHMFTRRSVAVAIISGVLSQAAVHLDALLTVIVPDVFVSTAEVVLQSGCMLMNILPDSVNIAIIIPPTNAYM